MFLKEIELVLSLRVLLYKNDRLYLDVSINFLPIYISMYPPQTFEPVLVLLIHVIYKLSEMFRRCLVSKIPILLRLNVTHK